MITEADLQAAIAECQGERKPNANTAIKLAAFLTIQRELFGVQESGYAYSAGPEPEQAASPVVSLASKTEFARAINGMEPDKAWELMDELMTTLAAINPRLYNGVMQRLRM